MKKLLVVVISMLFVLSMAAYAFAIHSEIPSETQAVVAKGATQLTIGGEVRVRGEVKQNAQDFNDDAVDHDAFYDQRVRLSVGVDAGDTTGLITLESGSTSDTYTWGETDSVATGGYPVGNAKRGSLNILEAWMLQKFGTVGLKVGHMPLALGNKLFFDHTKFGDDAIVIFADPTKELHIGALTAKFDENTNNLNDDANGYVGLFTYKAGNMGVSGDVTFVDDQGRNIHAWNIGLRGNLSAGGLGVMGDVEIQTGQLNEGLATELDIKGWAALVGVDYKLDMVKLSAAYAYGSGDDNAADTDFETFITSLGKDKHYTYVYEYRTNTAAKQGVSAGLANTTYVMLGLDASPTKEFNINAQLYRLWATEDVAMVAGTPDSDLGWEFDAKATYKVSKNLTYFVEGGYLFVGDAFDLTPATDGDNAYAVRHGIQLNF